MKHLSIDLETRSSADLARCGVYRYAAAPDFTLLLFGYSADRGPVQVIDLAQGERVPGEVIAALTDPTVEKWAFNAQFERVCLSRWLGLPVGEYLNPESWFCSMVWARELGLPGSLEGVGELLRLERCKLTTGRELLRRFSMPVRGEQGPVWQGPRTDPRAWTDFKEYNRRDVETELELQSRLAAYPLPASEWAHYHLDQRINDRGVRVDLPLARQAIRCREQSLRAGTDLARELTGLANPNSPAQLKDWLAEEGLPTESLSKTAVEELLTRAEGDAETVLRLRRSLAKSSVSKYAAMETAACPDSRVRGLLQFYGAARTGRFAGRLIQVQNLPQNHLEALGEARALLRAGEFEGLEAAFGPVSGTLSELIRTAFVPKEGCRFFVADFSAVEARCLSWLAGESWRTEVFRRGEDIYCASASAMFGVPVEKNGVNGHLRQKGKIAELALGYGGSVGALKSMGALRMGLKEEELPPLVESWRRANPHITGFWRKVDRAVKQCLRSEGSVRLGNLLFTARRALLIITLPSGRSLFYLRPREEPGEFGTQVSYEGVSGEKKWERVRAYGAKFVENLVQAYARDLLVEAMQRLEARGLPIVMHIHDEVVIEAPAETDLAEICRVMAETPSWAEGLPLRADGYVCDFYKKE